MFSIIGQTGLKLCSYKAYIVLTLVIALVTVVTVLIFSKENIIRWISVKFCEDVYGAQRMLLWHLVFMHHQNVGMFNEMSWQIIKWIEIVHILCPTQNEY